LAEGISPIKNPGSVGEAVNYFVPSDPLWGNGKNVKGAQNIPITKTDSGTAVRHATADDITSPEVIRRIEEKLSQIYK
jgi:hypothetical protein